MGQDVKWLLKREVEYFKMPPESMPTVCDGWSTDKI